LLLVLVVAASHPIHWDFHCYRTLLKTFHTAELSCAVVMFYIIWLQNKTCCHHFHFRFFSWNMLLNIHITSILFNWCV
jgi:hypothetical protein